MEEPMIVGPFGLTLQWYLGIGTGFVLCLIVGRIAGWFAS